MKINNKRELQNIAINDSGDIDYQDFIKIYRQCTKEPYNFLTIDTSLPTTDPLRFRKKLFEIFNKGLDKDDKKEGLFKRLENIKDKNEEQLQAIKDRGEKQLKELKNIDKNKTLKAIDEISKENDEVYKLLFEFKKIDETLDNAELVCTKTDGTKDDFNLFLLPLKFIEKIYKYEITLDEAIEKQAELKELINKLYNYGQRISKEIEEKNRVLKSAKKLFDTRDDIIDLFEKATFPYKGNVFKTNKEESEENKFQKIKDDYKKFTKYIEDESKGIDYDLFEEYFNFSVPSALLKQLYEIKNKKENDELVELIRVRWSNLKDKIKKMSKKNRKWKTT